MSDGAELVFIIIAIIACVKIAGLRNEAKRIADATESMLKLAKERR
jgi:hypothetical protein